MNLLKLAERVEAATAGCRELDADIWEAIGGAPECNPGKPYGHWQRTANGRYHFADDSSWGRVFPRQNSPPA